MRQGQVIGYVGSTGLSTGPTCTTRCWSTTASSIRCAIKLPRGRVLDGPTLANFEKERDRFDGMMNRPAPRVAETKGTTTRR